MVKCERLEVRLFTTGLMVSDSKIPNAIVI